MRRRCKRHRLTRTVARWVLRRRRIPRNPPHGGPPSPHGSPAASPSSQQRGRGRGMAGPRNRLWTLTRKKTVPAGVYADGGGLYLQVSEQATKAWIFRFTRAGSPRKMGLGPVSVKPEDKRITLADARQKAAA